MGTLIDHLLKSKQHTKKTNQTNRYMTETVDLSKKSDNSEFNISDEDLAKIRASVVSIDTEGKNRKQITIGTYGNIKNPSTGKRFVIPLVDYTDEDYIYKYAEMMRILVNKPEDFKKIMMWE